jgi:hypothetical protein
VNRILWNRRPGPKDIGDIDELVLHNVHTVHIEQMDDRCWWIGISLSAGAEPGWSGVFVADSRGRMRFGEQENIGLDWELDDTHEGEG